MSLKVWVLPISMTETVRGFGKKALTERIVIAAQAAIGLGSCDEYFAIISHYSSQIL